MTFSRTEIAEGVISDLWALISRCSRIKAMSIHDWLWCSFISLIITQNKQISCVNLLFNFVAMWALIKCKHTRVMILNKENLSHANVTDEFKPLGIQERMQVPFSVSVLFSNGVKCRFFFDKISLLISTPNSNILEWLILNCLFVRISVFHSGFIVLFARKLYVSVF